MNLLILFLCLITVNTQLLVASELRMNREQALRKGFLPQKRFSNFVQPVQMIAKNSLPWPVEFYSETQTIGNSTPEFQNYGGESYFHSGSDLRVQKESQVFAPVTGFLKANYYTYVTNPQTGEDTKFTKPISEGGDSLYFEVTIETTDGYRFELHHVNPKSLPDPIRKIALAGGGFVDNGTIVGRAAVWPIYRFDERYDHVHYNIIDPRGIYLNPEFASHEISDDQPPQILNIYAVVNGQTTEIKTDQLRGGKPTELIISALDYKGKNIYPLPPVSVEVLWGDHQKSGWDFSMLLADASGFFPDIRKVYARNVRLTDGRRISTSGDYENTLFLYKVVLPSEAKSPYVIQIKDSVGNIKQRVLRENLKF